MLPAWAARKSRVITHKMGEPRLQLVGQSPQCARHGHSGSVGRPEAEAMRDLSQVPLEFDPSDDQLAISWTKADERFTVAFVRFGPNGDLEGRHSIGG